MPSGDHVVHFAADCLAVAVLPDGGIALPQRFAGKVVVIEPDGTPREVLDVEPIVLQPRPLAGVA